MLTLAIAAQVLQADLLGDGALDFTGVSSDSRTIARGELFVALAGENFDGHDYLPEAAARGAVAAIVARERADAGQLALLRVSDPGVALRQLASFWRQRFRIPVIAVTGSNGKTTSKEMIAAILAAQTSDAERLATRGNLNNQIGVPLTLLGLRPQHQAAVIELGINHPGETALLAQMTAPTITLINNAQREHQEFMHSVAAVAQEHRLAIDALADSGIAVFPAHDRYASLWRAAAGTRRCIEFVVSDNQHSPLPVAVSACLINRNPDRTRHALNAPFITPIELRLPTATGQETIQVDLRAAGMHNVHNAAAAAAAAVAAGVSIDAIRRGLHAFRPAQGRLEKKQTSRGALLIDDSYNANPDSVRAAIDVLVAAPAPHTLVLGDMGEVGVHSAQFHAEIGQYAAQRGVDTLLALGAAMQYAVAAFGCGAYHFGDIERLTSSAQYYAASGTLLIKGSRFMRMERVVQTLLAPAPSAQALEESSD